MSATSSPVTITGLATNTTYTITLNAQVAGNTVQSASTTALTGPFFPTTNLLFDFNAKSGTNSTTNNSAVTLWTDARSGISVGSAAANGNGTGTYFTNSINGFPAISTSVSSGMGQSSWITISSAPSWTGFVVFNTGSSFTSNQGGSSFLTGPNAGLQFEVYQNHLQPSSNGVASGPPATNTMTNNTNYIWSVIYNSSAITHRVNGVDYTPASNTYSTVPKIGGSFDIRSAFGTIGEIIL